jgi:hypothetical protein
MNHSDNLAASALFWHGLKRRELVRHLKSRGCALASFNKAETQTATPNPEAHKERISCRQGQD